MRRHAYWIVSLLFALLVLAKFSPITGFTSLIRFGETWNDRRHSSLTNVSIAVVPGSNGYDGQFYAQLAMDPLLRSPDFDRVIDYPAYRARRILAPATAFLLGFGKPWWILQAYALLNVACWFAFGWLLRGCIGTQDWIGFARWVGCMFSMGVLDSVRQSLVDLPALLLLSFGVVAYAKSRNARSRIWLALGTLAKETCLLGAIALYADGLASSTRRSRTLLGLLVVAAPIGLWSVYVFRSFGGPIAATGLGNFTWPLLGMLDQARICSTELLAGNFDSRYTFCLAAMAGLSIQAAVLWRAPDFQSPWWRVGAAYSLLMPILGLWVWSGYWAACRALLPMTIAFNLLVPANRHFWPSWIAGNLTLLHAVWRFI